MMIRMHQSSLAFLALLLISGIDAFSTVTPPKQAAPPRTVDLQTLPLPPSRKPGPFRKIRDFVSYLKNPQTFTERRAKELGPVFSTNLFLKPAVVIGGKTNVEDFIAKERQAKVIHAALPDTFMELHTPYGALNLDSTDVLHQQARVFFATTLGKNALAYYADFLEREMEAYVEQMAQKVRANPEHEFFLVPELSDFCLQLFAKMYSGEGLTAEQVTLFRDYNSGLLAPTRSSKAFQKGFDAMNQLIALMEERLKTPVTEAPGKLAYDALMTLEGYVDMPERRAPGMMLMIWGAYAESAGLMTNALTLLRQMGDGPMEEMRSEYAKVQTLPGLDKWNEFHFATGVVRESLRLIPQVGGGFRYSDNDFEVAGYRIPAGTTVTVDPRIGNIDPNLYVDPMAPKPERWMPAPQESSGCPFRGSALGRGPGAWFPGGTGAHGCPGIGLAELVTKIFLTQITQKFDSWEYTGSGLTRSGDIKYVEIPIKVPVDDFGVRFTLRQ